MSVRSSSELCQKENRSHIPQEAGVLAALGGLLMEFRRASRHRGEVQLRRRCRYTAVE
jgi:hypothetical protein